jgi:hypothetical protein
MIVAAVGFVATALLARRVFRRGDKDRPGANQRGTTTDTPPV